MGFQIKYNCSRRKTLLWIIATPVETGYLRMKQSKRFPKIDRMQRIHSVQRIVLLKQPELISVLSITPFRPIVPLSLVSFSSLQVFKRLSDDHQSLRYAIHFDRNIQTKCVFDWQILKKLHEWSILQFTSIATRVITRALKHMVFHSAMDDWSDIRSNTCRSKKTPSSELKSAHIG